MSETGGSSWWKTLPGVLTGIAGVLTAITGLIVALQQTGVFNKEEAGSHATQEESVLEAGETIIAGINIPAYVIVDEAFKSKQSAQRRLVELSHSGYSNTGFFWIPDFEYLSGAELFQVYVGPFNKKANVEAAICEYNIKFGKVTYGVKLSNRPGREEVRCK